MIFNTQIFARKYALIYTGILAILLILPLIIYVILLLQIDEAKVKITLNNQSKIIINAMQRYDNKDKVYHFPRFKEYETALFDEKFQTIFSTLNFKPRTFTEGYHRQGKHHYLIYTLPPSYYFGAQYMLVSTIHTANNIYFFAALVMIGIVITLFFFSLLLLKKFSEPFEKLNAQLDNFIKDSMHEINTPLSIINLNSDLFANKYGENKYLKRMKSASKTLATIYNDMDYLVKKGRVEYKKKTIDFSEFIQRRVDYFQEIANLKGITLETSLGESITAVFFKTKLQRIVDNTLSNAIKYSNDQSEIKISLYKTNENIVFSVEDNGIGIENIEKIFSRYYRENESKGGFGIGLNIVKDIIEEESIDLKVQSTVGKGSTFSYTFIENN